jgi:UDP-N-acetylmuramoyl-tripeptide--D-alanyl-D-alanine ligase
LIGETTLSAVAADLQGELHGSDARFSSISIDTRTLQPGDLYIAIKGLNFDGHDFLLEAEDKGACGAIVSTIIKSQLPQLQVLDTRVALGQLAHLNRCKSKATVVGITGSQGKTTVKEMIGQILGLAGNTLVTRGNLNNAIGVPLTLFELSEEHDYAVIEMGANSPGEIHYTARLVAPDVGLITNAYRAHIEGFGSLQGVCEAKGELIDNVGDGATMVLNADDQFFKDWQQRAEGKRTVSFALNNGDATYSASDITRSDSGALCFKLRRGQTTRTVTLNVLGRHNINNATAAAAAAMEAGASIDHVVQGLEKIRPVRGRLSSHKGIHGSVIIDDSYNASPDSFRAAIRALVELKGERILAMGDMGELGNEADSAHQEIGKFALDSGVDQLWVVGEKSRQSALAFGDAAEIFVDKANLIKKCAATLTQGTTLLVKGSRSSNMTEIVDAVIAR